MKTKKTTWRETYRQFLDAMRLRLKGAKTARERVRLQVSAMNDIQDAAAAAEVELMSPNARRLLIALPAENDDGDHGYPRDAWEKASGLPAEVFALALAELRKDFDGTHFVNGSEGEGYWHMGGLHRWLLVSKSRAA